MLLTHGESRRRPHRLEREADIDHLALRLPAPGDSVRRLALHAPERARASWAPLAVVQRVGDVLEDVLDVAVDDDAANDLHRSPVSHVRELTGAPDAVRHHWGAWRE